MQELKPAINAQEYLNEKYPNKVDRAKLTELKISCKSLEGPLDLSDFVNLEALFCYYNYLTYLNIEKCQKLEVIECASNLIEADLNIFSCLINLKKLDLGLHITGVGVPGKITTEKDQVQPGTKRKQQPFSDSLDCQNNFYGSLKSLENCQQLEFLCIALQKNVKGGLEYLPTEKLRWFGCNYTEFEEQLKPYNFKISLWGPIYAVKKQQLENKKSTYLSSAAERILKTLEQSKLEEANIWLVDEYNKLKKINSGLELTVTALKNNNEAHFKYHQTQITDLENQNEMLQTQCANYAELQSTFKKNHDKLLMDDFNKTKQRSISEEKFIQVKEKLEKDRSTLLSTITSLKQQILNLKKENEQAITQKLTLQQTLNTHSTNIEQIKIFNQQVAETLITPTVIPFFSSLETLLNNQRIIYLSIFSNTNKILTNSSEDLQPYIQNIRNDCKDMFTSFQQTTQAVNEIKSTVIKTTSYILVSYFILVLFFILKRLWKYPHSQPNHPKKNHQSNCPNNPIKNKSCEQKTNRNARY